MTLMILLLIGCSAPGQSEQQSGTEVTVTTGAISFDLRYIRSGSYYVGDNPPAAANVTLTDGYWIGETEVTYNLWYEVYQWATDDTNGDGIIDDDGNGSRNADGGLLYDFANSGAEGSSGSPGAAPTPSTWEPVVAVSWRDNILFCNALSEKSGLSPVYCSDIDYLTPLRTVTTNAALDTTAGHEDNPYVNWNANGYRMPTEVEWEIAGRGAGPAISAGTYGTTYAGSDIIDDVAWIFDNSGVESHDVGTLDPNELGLYDMSGNVLEFCWDWYGGTFPFAGSDPSGPVTGTERETRSGTFGWSASGSEVTRRVAAYSPPSSVNALGIRIAKNQ